MRIRSLLLSILLFAATGAYAQAPAMPKKMVIIDFDRAVLTNNEGIKAKGQLEVHLKTWQDKSDAEAAKRKVLNDKLAQSSLTEQQKINIRSEIAEIDRNVNRMREDAKLDIETKRTQLFTGIAERVKKVLKDYGEEEGLAAVLNYSPLSDGIVIYRSDVADVTSEVTRRVNADITKNPISAKPAAAAPDKKP